MQETQAIQTTQYILHEPKEAIVQTQSPFDINALFSAAILNAVNAATTPLLTRIAALEARLEDITTASDERIKEIAEEVARDAMTEHADEYDHDEYDRMEDKLDEKVTEMMNDFVDNFDFEDKVRDIMRNASINIDI
jgi:predicted house-cleaning noncanonical NTP pyrophosphatase (MazG superfamily)